MEIFIILTKCNTLQRQEEGKSPLIIVSNEFMRNGTYSLMFIGRVYNNSIGDLFTAGNAYKELAALFKWVNRRMVHQYIID